MNNEKTVYLVRHGESEGNIVPVFQPPTSPLSPKGRMQADQIADRVSKLSFEALIASPILRAKETALAIAQKTGKEPEFSDLLVERVKPTSINGKPYTDSEAAALWKDWNESLYLSGIRYEDGENFDDIVRRADQTLEFLLHRPEQSLVVVTHGYFLRTLVARVLLGELLTGELFKRFQRISINQNTGISVLRHRATAEEHAHWRLWVYNDHAHLE